MTLPIYDEEVRAEAACEEWPVRLFMPEARGGPGPTRPGRHPASRRGRAPGTGHPWQIRRAQSASATVAGTSGGYLFGELSPIKDSYVPTRLGKNALASQPGETASERVAARAPTTPRPIVIQNTPRKSATRTRGGRREEVARLVEAHPGASTSELAGIGGLSHHIVKHHLYRLLEDGAVLKESLRQGGFGPRTRWWASTTESS